MSEKFEPKFLVIQTMPIRKKKREVPSEGVILLTTDETLQKALEEKLDDYASRLSVHPWKKFQQHPSFYTWHILNHLLKNGSVNELELLESLEDRFKDKVDGSLFARGFAVIREYNEGPASNVIESMGSEKDKSETTDLQDPPLSETPSDRPV